MLASERQEVSLQGCTPAKLHLHQTWPDLQQPSAGCLLREAHTESRALLIPLLFTGRRERIHAHKDMEGR